MTDSGRGHGGRATGAVRMWIRRGSVGSASQGRILGCEKCSEGCV